MRAWTGLASAAAVAVAVVAIADAGAGAQTGQTFTYTKRQTSHFRFVDQAPRTTMGSEGPERLSVGDQIVQHDAYLDAAGKRVGALDLVCTVTRGGTFATAAEQCVATATLPGGTLTVSSGGGFDVHVGAIVGGTGRFAGAKGTLEARPGKGDTTQDAFTLL